MGRFGLSAFGRYGSYRVNSQIISCQTCSLKGNNNYLMALFVVDSRLSRSGIRSL